MFEDKILEFYLTLQCILLCNAYYIYGCHDKSICSMHKHLQYEKLRRLVFVPCRYVNFLPSHGLLNIRHVRHLKIAVECGNTRKMIYF